MIITLAIIIWVSCSAANDSNYYYYFNDEKIYLRLDTNYIFIKFSNELVETIDTFLLEFQSIEYVADSIYNIEGFRLFKIMESNCYSDLTRSVKEYKFTQFINPVFINHDSIPLFIGETFLCRFKPYITDSEIWSFADSCNIDIDRHSDVISNKYIFRIGNGTELSTLEIANAIYEIGIATYSQPNFYSWIRPDGYDILDEYYTYQWNIEKVVGLPDYDNAAWEVTIEIQILLWPLLIRELRNTKIFILADTLQVTIALMKIQYRSL